MAKKAIYDEVSVVRSLSKKSSINIKSHNKVIEIVKNNTDVGNGSWGKIDYLVKVHGYFVNFVNKINTKKIINKNIDEEDNHTRSKTAKREAKLNMATMAKNAMRKAKSK